MMSRLPPAAALVLSFVIFFGYVTPTYSGSIKELRASIEREQTALDAAERFTEKQNELAQAKNSISPANLEQLETLLPDSVNNVGVILDITSLAARSGVQLSSIDAAPPTSGVGDPALSSVGAIDLTLSVAGSYKAFLTFLAGIERSARILDVVGFDVRGSDTGVYIYDLVVRLYWLR